MVDFRSTEEWLTHANDLVPVALEAARPVKRFSGRWNTIISKLEQTPSRLSDLSSHLCFSKNTLCHEQLQAMSKTLTESIELANKCSNNNYEGKLQMQSDLDVLLGKLDLNLRDCGLLVKTGALSGCTLQEGTSHGSNNIRELLARLQIGHLEAKHKALDTLVEVMKDDEKTVLSLLRRSNVSALVQLLTATSPRVQAKTVTLICSLVDSDVYENWLISEGVLPPLIRLLESGSAVCREKSTIALQRLSMSLETARSVVGHGGVQPLVEVCRTGDSISQTSAACTLKNLSVQPESRETLAGEGVIEAMIDLLGHGISLLSKEYAAECLRNLTVSDENIKQFFVTKGGVSSLLAYLDGPLPQEPAVEALRNLVGFVSVETLVSLGFVQRLAHVLKSGSPQAQKAATSAICRICSTSEAKKFVGESGCVQLLIKLLEAKENGVREMAAQAVASLMTVSCNRRVVKRDEKGVANLVFLLDPSVQNTAKKYAIFCLGLLCSSKRCRKLMIAYGAIGYLKKLKEMEINGSKGLLERLERGGLRNLFGKN